MTSITKPDSEDTPQAGGVDQAYIDEVRAKLKDAGHVARFDEAMAGLERTPEMFAETNSGLKSGFGGFFQKGSRGVFLALDKEGITMGEGDNIEDARMIAECIASMYEVASGYAEYKSSKKLER